VAISARSVRSERNQIRWLRTSSATCGKLDLRCRNSVGAGKGATTRNQKSRTAERRGWRSLQNHPTGDRRGRHHGHRSVAVPHGNRAASRDDLKRYLQTAAWQDGRERPLVERPIIKWPEPAPRPGADRFRSRMGVGDMMVSATTAINAQPFQFGCALSGRPTVPQPCNHAPIEIGWVVAHPRARGSLLRSYRNFAPLALRSRCGLASLKGQHGD